MAVTKIHPIKSTLKKALDYIENPAKTDEKMLVSSFACSYETADIEFELLLSQAMQKGNNLAHHLIQSFAPGETTPEQAHEIGRQLADEVLQGKYPYVLTTHIDKGHVHNHVIFCAVDMVNQRKYVSNRQSYAMPRKYVKIDVYGKEILELKREGKTNQEIAQKLGVDRKCIRNWVFRFNRQQRKLAAGIKLHPKGRPRKDAQPRDIVAEQAYEINRLKMENELLRDFMQSMERK